MVMRLFAAILPPRVFHQAWNRALRAAKADLPTITAISKEGRS
jgi:hypothetical protein